jgi:hypothetical protein
MKVTTFWSLLKDNKITIPIVQRDYAQGRADQLKVRKRFLKSLTRALKGEKNVLLDYVYGNQENDNFTPLDGQQRLTTLWLLHWYLAMRLNLIQDEEIKKTLLKFSYETRVSSSDFCESLCNESISSVNDIEKKIWFYSSFKNEPTISAMLRMLKGTGMEDGIDEVLKSSNNAELQSYWDNLTRDYQNNEQPPIAFYYFPLEKYRLTDDLYIKMNARGKALTDFENFKADFLDLVKKRFKDDNSSLAEDTLEIEASKRKVEFASKMDNDWTDIFWKYRTENDIIDDIYLAFINRFFLNYLIVSDDTVSADKWESNLQEKAENSLGKKLYRDELSFDDFELYENETEGEIIGELEKCLDSVSKNILNIVAIQDHCNPKWEDVNRNPIKDKGNLIPQFYFIPKYYKTEENGRQVYKVNEITLQERIAFYAVCVYLEKDDFEENSFVDWVRIVWNFIENVSGHYSVSLFVNELRQIHKLKEHSHDIVSFLSSVDCNNSIFTLDAIKEQVKEEILKAKKIAQRTETEEGTVIQIDKNWKEKILYAENALFFRGAIRFLYRDENGAEDWDKFGDRLANAKKYFTKDGEAKGDIILLRTFISLFVDWENHFKEINFDNQKDTWRRNLLNAKLQKPVAKLLNGTSCDFNTFTSTFKDPYYRYIQNYIVKTTMLNTLVEGCYLHDRRDWCGGVWALHPYNAKAEWKIYFLHYRNELLCSNNEITFFDENMNSRRKNKICWGKNIRFTYGGREFMWTNENKIHLMSKDGSGIIKDVYFEGCKPDEEMNWEDFKNKLDGLM